MGIDPKVEVILDFDYIIGEIDKMKKPILLYCEDGDSVSCGISIAYLMITKKMNV